MAHDYLRNATAPAIQTERARADQVENSAGGYVFELDGWERLHRFLILGSEGGTYYASERKLTKENAAVVEHLLSIDGPRLVRTIIEVSESGRAPKNDPALLALALAAKKGDEATRTAAYTALPRVARIGTHLYHFAQFVNDLGGWGRKTRRAIGAWFNTRTPDDLARQLVKYRSRDGWSARDLLRLSHVKPASPAHDVLYRWACAKGEQAPALDRYKLPVGAELHSHVAAFEELQREPDVRRACALIEWHQLPREAVPTQHLTNAAVWEALLPHMGLTALVRNLATMTRVGVLAPLAPAVHAVCSRLTDAAALAKARVHPIQMLSALRTYTQGHGERGASTWVPVQQVVDALDAGFYASFQSVEPSGKATLLALDVSGSMTSGAIAGIPGLTPREASAAMALVTASREPRYHIMGFSHRLVEVPISPKMRLDRACEVIERIPMGATDCSLPMVWARENKARVESFAVYTDNETYAGRSHPYTELGAHRKWSGLAAKLAVVGMTSTQFTIADPKDAGMLDFVGFDAAAPAVMADFFAGRG